jgi:hypothetical protein
LVRPRACRSVLQTADDPKLRTSILRGIILGGVSWIVVFASASFLVTFTAPPSQVERVLYTLRLCGIPGALLFAMYTQCLRFRDAPGAINPLLGVESERRKINQRVLTNTVEQTLIFVLLLLSLSTAVDAAHMFVIPILAATWSLGRIGFWVGYRLNVGWRAPGMQWTALSNIATLACLLYFTLR